MKTYRAELYRNFHNEETLEDLYFLASGDGVAVRQVKKYVKQFNELLDADTENFVIHFRVFDAGFPTFRKTGLYKPHGRRLYDSLNPYRSSEPAEIIGVPKFDVEAFGGPGGLASVIGLTNKGKRWIGKNVNVETWQWQGSKIVLDGSYLADIIKGMIQSGLKVKCVDEFKNIV